MEKAGIEILVRQGKFRKIKDIISRKMKGLEYGDAVEVRSSSKNVVNRLKNYIDSECSKEYYTKSSVVLVDNNSSDSYVLHIVKDFNVNITQKDVEEAHRLLKKAQAEPRLKKANKANYA